MRYILHYRIALVIDIGYIDRNSFFFFIFIFLIAHTRRKSFEKACKIEYYTYISLFIILLFCAGSISYEFYVTRQPPTIRLSINLLAAPCWFFFFKRFFLAVATRS